MVLMVRRALGSSTIVVWLGAAAFGCAGDDGSAETTGEGTTALGTMTSATSSSTSSSDVETGDDDGSDGTSTGADDDGGSEATTATSGEDATSSDTGSSACPPGEVMCAGGCEAPAPGPFAGNLGDAGPNTLMSLPADEIGQSFEAPIDGWIVEIALGNGCSWGTAATITAAVHEGGVCDGQPCNGPVLEAALDPLCRWTLDGPVAVEAGEVYTFQMASGMAADIWVEDADSYPDGRALGPSDTTDLTFAVSFASCP